MSHRSRAASFSWSNAKRDMRGDRQQMPAGFLSARGRVEGAVRFGRVALVNADGSFDRVGIMSAAAEAAKAHQTRFGGTWDEAMSVALKAAWQAARTTRTRSAH
ncbi:hypothetical protein [Methylorubrum suomiense]|uniref:Uncharacterized protein n=1 Tax=Methylorubrum suomiense TaxID=144191 RepID=A0ABQ4V2B8_9HYPH|nr:hypothetical protein [Methylorubrum suomiense]GJE78582.1 hypothetical protein BGCPKDLD_5199 [Methylorubrum suomiense]